MTENQCPFCAYAAGKFSRELLIYEDQDVLVVPSLHQKPMNQGHCLVVTRAHVPNIYELPDALAAPVLRTVSTAARASKKAFAADGVSIRQNNDPAGNQDVFHIHFHVVPRFEGDDFHSAEFPRVDEQTRIRQAEVLRRAWSA